MTGTMKAAPHNIYIHVPFCMSKCNYCAFYSQACATPDWDGFTRKICTEIKYWGEKMMAPNVPTVFFGGGTPSLMPVKTFEKIMSAIRQYFYLIPNAEITLESNPGTLSQTKLNDLVQLGVNRLSTGVQRLNDEQLQFLGRKHTVADAYRLLESAQNMGIRVSADLIYGIPNDTVNDVIQMCHAVNQMGITHCSLYELTIEPNTPFGKMNLDMPDNETMAQMYLTIADNLNLPRYEVSNYATPGHECRHNQNVWDGMPYIGIGTGAAGRILQDGQWYEQMGNNEIFTPISNKARATEQIITGMRTKRGCQLTEHVKNVINSDWIKSNPQHVQINDERVWATDAGMLILDELITKMVL